MKGLRQFYAERAGRALAASTNWDMLGAFRITPESYHFTKSAHPDKRYKNYPEVLAFYEAELEERAEYINNAINREDLGEI